MQHIDVENNVINLEQILVQVKVPWKIKHRPPSCIFPFPLPQLLPPVNSMTEMFLCFQDFWTLTWPKLSQGQRRVGVWVIMYKQRGFIAFTYMSLLPWLWSPSANSAVAWLKKVHYNFWNEVSKQTLKPTRISKDNWRNLHLEKQFQDFSFNSQLLERGNEGKKVWTEYN